MIDEYYTWIFYGYHSDDLKPRSCKPIVVVCDECSKYRVSTMDGYRDLCNSCSKQTPEFRENARLKTIEQFSNPNARDAARLRSIEQWSDPEARAEMSIIIINSDAHKVASSKKLGGFDIIEHHMIYDHSDLTKNTIPMARSTHMKLHRLFQKHGIEIPHINIQKVM